MRLLLIRHAQSAANAEGRLQGRLDFPLSDHGLRQSERLADRLAALSIDRLYASPLLRASQTAEIIASRLGLPLTLRPALMERDVGEIAGLTRDEILAKFPHYARARAELLAVDVPGFEQDDAFAARVKRALDPIIGAHGEETVAVVTHGGIIFSFCRQRLGMATVRPAPFAIDNASITMFDVATAAEEDGRRPAVRLIALNDTCHLDGR
jgi:broad specificity phosphatase PhoE